MVPYAHFGRVRTLTRRGTKVLTRVPISYLPTVACAHLSKAKARNRASSLAAHRYGHVGWSHYRLISAIFSSTKAGEGSRIALVWFAYGQHCTLQLVWTYARHSSVPLGLSLERPAQPQRPSPCGAQFESSFVGLSTLFFGLAFS